MGSAEIGVRKDDLVIEDATALDYAEACPMRSRRQRSAGGSEWRPVVIDKLHLPQGALEQCLYVTSKAVARVCYGLGKGQE